MSHVIIREGSMTIDVPRPEGEPEKIHVHLTYSPTHYANNDEVMTRAKQIRKKLLKFYERLAEEYEDE